MYRGRTMKLLLVEDDRQLADFLVRVFKEEGYETDLCRAGREGAVRAREGVYDAMVLDWMLPDGDGLSVCREARRLGCTMPILMLTARGEVRDRVLGLDTGADDYLVKPFEVEELLARISALIRRSTGTAPLRIGRLEVFRDARKVLVEGAIVDLTDREFALLSYFFNNQGATLPRQSLLRDVWGLEFETNTNVVEVHISRLRDKLGSHSWVIETVRGAGYRLRTQLP